MDEIIHWWAKGATTWRSIREEEYFTPVLLLEICHWYPKYFLHYLKHTNTQPCTPERRQPETEEALLCLGAYSCYKYLSDYTFLQVCC